MAVTPIYLPKKRSLGEALGEGFTKGVERALDWNEKMAFLSIKAQSDTSGKSAEEIVKLAFTKAQQAYTRKQTPENKRTLEAAAKDWEAYQRREAEAKQHEAREKIIGEITTKAQLAPLSKRISRMIEEGKIDAKPGTDMLREAVRALRSGDLEKFQILARNVEAIEQRGTLLNRLRDAEAEAYAGARGRLEAAAPTEKAKTRERIEKWIRNELSLTRTDIKKFDMQEKAAMMTWNNLQGAINRTLREYGMGSVRFEYKNILKDLPRVIFSPQKSGRVPPSKGTTKELGDNWREIEVR